jgi:hypothetical protein
MELASGANGLGTILGAVGCTLSSDGAVAAGNRYSDRRIGAGADVVCKAGLRVNTT